MNVGFVSLGCSKNLIDTEVTVGLFKDHHYVIVNDPAKADIIVVNTCGFIDSAKEEAINTILEMAEYKKQRCRYLVAMGCLVQRYYDDLKKLLPEVDLFIKLENYDSLWQAIEDMIKMDVQIKPKNKTNLKISEITQLPMLEQEEYMERVVTTGQNYAYLKIGEGCSNFCTYCAIPYIRGKFISRKIEDILEEAKMLASKGIKELIVIAQDTTKYGIDIYGEPKLAELLKKISEIPEIRWIRFLYSYPEGISDELIDLVAENNKIAKYFDIPLDFSAKEFQDPLTWFVVCREIGTFNYLVKKEYLPVLTRKAKQLIYRDEYGDVHYEKFLNELLHFAHTRDLEEIKQIFAQNMYQIDADILNRKALDVVKENLKK